MPTATAAVAVAGIIVLPGADFLGLVLILMMAGEMTIIAVCMVMFTINPAGLNPMVMVHQHRTAMAAGVAAWAAGAGAREKPPAGGFDHDRSGMNQVDVDHHVMGHGANE